MTRNGAQLLLMNVKEFLRRKWDVPPELLIKDMQNMLESWEEEVHQLSRDMQALVEEIERMRKEIAEADARNRDLTNQVKLFGTEA